MKTVIITGVSGGMGNAVSEHLARAGYTVFGLDLKDPANTNLHMIPTDLTDPDSVEQAVQAVGKLTDGIDGIIHMAGIYNLNSLVEISEEDFLKLFQVNLFAAYRVNKAFLPLLRKNGRIILTSSELAPLHPLPFTGLYAITKTALEQYACSLRMELQMLGYDVIILRPGAVATNMLNASEQALASFCSHTERYPGNAEKFRRIVDRIETRNVPPRKIADIVEKAINAKRPKLVYKINRNPLLLLMNGLPVRIQLLLIKRLLRQHR